MLFPSLKIWKREGLAIFQNEQKTVEHPSYSTLLRKMSIIKGKDDQVATNNHSRHQGTYRVRTFRNIKKAYCFSKLSIKKIGTLIPMA